MIGARIGAALGVALLLASSPVSSAAEKTAPASQREREVLMKEVQKLREEARPFTELFTKTIELALPSVVSVTTTRTPKMSAVPFEFPLPFGEGPEMPGRPFHPRPRGRPEPVTGLGSGFVVDAEKGYVVTNAHVVRDVEAKHVKLTFQDGREVTAEKVFIDPRADVAVIKIPADHLVALQWGDRDTVKHGQWVIAVGSPMGFGGSVTAGIVSAPSTRHRFFGGGRPGEFHPNEDPYAVEDYIQTDAAINPGNSGGPLISLDGKVIGVNTLIVSSTLSSAGLGFAVPARIARPVVDALMETGRVVRGHLGVAITDPARMDDRSAQELFDLPTADQVFKKFSISRETRGALVAERSPTASEEPMPGVMPNGPADKAGIKPGDVILAVGATPTPDVDSLRDVIAGTKPGTTVEITLMREGKEKKLPVTLGEQPSGEKAWAEGPGGVSTNEDLGLTIQPLTPDLAGGLGYPENLKGLVVIDVAADSVAEKSGLQRNDVIIEVNRTPVSSVEEFDAAITKAGKGPIALFVRRGDSPRLIPLKLPK